MPSSKPTKQAVIDQLVKQVSDLSKQVAELMEQQTAPQPPAQKNGKGQPRPDVYYVLAGVPSKGFAPQAIACARVLATAANVNHIPEAEAMKLMELAKAEGRLRTRQDSWHIFQYYRPRLIEADYLRMITA